MQKSNLLFLLLSLSLQAFGQTYFPFRQQGKWGVYDKTTQKAYMTEFDSIAPFSQHYSRDFSSVDPFAIAYAGAYSKVIDYTGKVLLDSLLYASQSTALDENLVLKADFILNIFKFSKQEKELYGFFDPQKERILVPDIYNRINFFFDTTDQFRLYYYGYDPQKQALDIFDLSENKLVKAIPCENYDFDSKSGYGDVPQKLFLLVYSQGKTAILDVKGEHVVAPGIYQEIDFTEETIIVDNQVYNLEGELLGQRQEAEEEIDGYDADSEVYALANDDRDCQLIDLGDNTFSFQDDSELTFQLKKKWTQIALLDPNNRRCEAVSYISFSEKEKLGVYDFRKQKLVLKPNYQSILPFYCDVNHNYKQYTSLPTVQYSRTKSLELFSVENEDKSYNVYDPNSQTFMFDEGLSSISLVRNYDFQSFAYFLLADRGSYSQLYDVNGALLLDQIRSLSLENRFSKGEEKGHQVITYVNSLRLDRYLYVIFSNGDSGYFFIDNEHWEVNYLFPEK